MPRLIITCDEPPCPPLSGNNRKAADVIEALRADYDVQVLAYPKDDATWETLRDCWQGKGVTCHRLQRRLRGRHARMLREGLSLPTVTRDFAAEAELVRSLSREATHARLLVDFVSGAPLLHAFRGPGTVLSGHDCMSYLFQEESRYANGALPRAHFRLRRRFALHAERRFAHLPARVHVVSEQDAEALRRVNPLVRTAVIPIGGPRADARVLRPMAGRRERIIWGSLRSGLVVEGLRRIFGIVHREFPGAFRGWTLLGRVPEAEARRRFPGLDALGVAYRERAADIGALLGGAVAVLLPDVSGTGQKNRTVDSLAHGCCVLGTQEVFRGIEPRRDPAFVACGDFAELVRTAAELDRLPLEEIGRRAMRLHAECFSLEVLAARWRALLASAGWLANTETGMPCTLR